METRQFCREEPYHVVVRNHIFDTLVKEFDFGFYTLQDAVDKYIELIVSTSAVKQFFYNRNDDAVFWEYDDEGDFQYLDVYFTVGVFRILKPIIYECDEYEPKTGFIYGSHIYDIYDYQPPHNRYLADKLFEIGTSYTLEPSGIAFSHDGLFSDSQKKRAISEVFKSGNGTTNLDALSIVKNTACMVDFSNIVDVSKITNQLRPCARPYRNNHGFLVEYISNVGVSSVQYGKDFRWPLYALRSINSAKLSKIEDAISENKFSLNFLQGEDIYAFLRLYNGFISTEHLIQCFKNALPELKEAAGDWVYCLDNTQGVNYRYQFAFNMYQTEGEIAGPFFNHYCDILTEWVDLSIPQRKEFLLKYESDFPRFPTVIFDSYTKQRVLGYTTPYGGYDCLEDFLPGY